MKRLLAPLIVLPACTEYDFESEAPDPPAVPATSDPYSAVRTDHLAQRDPVDEVDVLWVVDNSGSMGDDQALLVESFPEFMNFFLGLEGVDYHVGVVSTDMYAEDGQGRLREVEGRRWIDDTVFDPIPMFQMMALMGTGGSGDEMGIAAAHAALSTERDAFNAGFYREDALLSVITVSDEPDYSYMLPVSEQEMVDFMLELKYEPGMVSYNTIVGPTPDGCATAQPGTAYETVRLGVGGIAWSICDSQWDELLERLAMQAAGMKQEFFLSEVPLEGTIQVRAIEPDGTELDFTMDVDYTWNPQRNSILFLEYLPPPFTDVDVTYEVDHGERN